MTTPEPSYTAWSPTVLAERIDEAAISRLVHTFYDRIRAHPELGPIFEAAIEDRWEAHLEKMVRFWSTMVLAAGTYDGRPLPPHIGLPNLQEHHFAQWLVLFRETATELFAPDLAEQFILRAERMAESFLLAIRFHEGRGP